MKYFIAAAAGCCVCGSALGDVLLTFGYTDLSGTYSTGTSDFYADAVDAGVLHSAGDVTRIGIPGGTANFDDGFVSRSSFADAWIALNVTSINNLTADGNGQLELTDDDGDTISADVSGQFINGGIGIYYFNGYLSNVVLSGTTFDGTDGGAFDMDLPGAGPYEGALIQLFIDGGSDFFSGDFADVSVQMSGEVIPAPAGIALLLATGALASRRRR